MALEYIANRLIGKRVTEVRHSAHYPVIAPARILSGHAHDQRLNFTVNPGAARIAARFVLSGSDSQQRDTRYAKGASGPLSR
jgi:hypothetical protein